MAELSDIRCVLIDPNKSIEAERLIYRYYPIFYSGYVNSNNEVIFLAWDNIDKTIKLVEKLTLDIMYFPDMESSKVVQPYLIKKSQLNIPSEWGPTPDLSTLGFIKKSSLLYTDIDTIKKTYPKPINFDVEESFYGTSQGGFKNGLEPFAFYGYESFEVFKTKNEFNKYKIYMNYEKNSNSTSLIHYECTCPTAKSPIIINLSVNDSITDNTEQNARACTKALEICNKGTCQTNETLPQEKLDLSIRECHDINDLLDQNIKVPCESTLSETPEHTIKSVPEITVDAVSESTVDNVDSENTIPVLPENTKPAVNENTTNGTAAIENPVNVVKINDDYAAITSTTTEWVDENNNKYFKSVSITTPFSKTALWFQNIIKRNIITNKQGGFITFKLLCIESWDAAKDNNIKIIFNSITLFEFHRDFGTNYTLDFQKNINISNKNIRFSFKSNDDYSLWSTNTGRPAAASNWNSQSFNVRIDYPHYAFDNIELVLDGAFDEGWDNESVGISDFVVTQTENTISETPEATTEVVSEVTNKEQPEITKPGNVEATRLDIPENTKPLIPASNITSTKNIINKYATKAYSYTSTKCLYFDNFNNENNWKLTANNSVYSNYMTVTNPNYGRLLHFLTQDLYKEYTINNSCSYEIHMDIFFIESWDSEAYIIKINGTKAVALAKPYQAGIANTSGTAVIGGVNIPWTFESRPDNFNWTCVPEYGNSFNSLSGNVKFKIPVGFGNNIRLGVTTTLDQVIGDESAGLGNIFIWENQVVTEPSTLEDNQTSSSELSYSGKPEVSIDKVDKITITGASEKTSPIVPESTKPIIPENTVDSVPENTKLFDCKDYQHCGEILSPEVIEKTIAEIPEETQYKNETTIDGTTEATTPGTLESTTDNIVVKDAVPEKTTPGTLENTVYDINTIQKNDKSVEITAPKIDENTIEAKPEDTIQLSDCDNIEKQCEYTIDENPEDTVYGTPEITIPEITTDLELEKVIKPFVPESTTNKIVETTVDAVPEATTPGTPEGTVSPIPEGTVPFKAESTVDVPPVPDTTQIKVNEKASGSNNQLAGGFLCKVDGLSNVNAYMDPLSVPDQFTIYGIRADGSKAELYNQTWGKSPRSVPLTVSGYTHLQIKVNKDSFISGTGFNFTIQGDPSLVKPGVGSENTTPQVPEVSQAEVPEVSVPLVPEVTNDEIPEDTVNTPVEVTVDEIQEGTLPEIPESTTPAHILEMGSDDYVIHAQTPEITNTFPCDDDMCEETIEGISENTIKEKPEITTLAIPENSIYAKNEEIELVEDTRNEIIESNNGVVSNRTIIENTTEVDKRYAVKYTDTKGNEDYYSSIDPLPSSYYYNDNIKLSYEEVLNTPYLVNKICIENTIGDSFDISIASPESTRSTTIQHDELTIPEIPEETTDAVAGRIITLGVPENTKYVPCENQRICEDTEPEQEEDTVTIIPGKSIPAVPEDTILGTPAVFEAYRPERTSEAVTPIYIPEIPENTIPYVPAVYIEAVTESTLDPVPEVTNNSTPEETIPLVPAVYIPFVPEGTTPEIPENTTPLVPAVNIPAVPENTIPAVPENTTPEVPENTTPLSETTSYTPPVQNATQINLNQGVSGSNNQLAGGFICKVKGLTTASVYMDPYGVQDQFTIYGIKSNNVATELFNQTWGNGVTKTIPFNVSVYDFLQVKVNKDSYVDGTGFEFRITGDASLVTVEAGTENTVNVPERTVPIVPERTVSMVPAITVSNYVPEVTLAEIPESTTPLVPEVTTPQVDETTIPEIPEITDDAVPEDTTPYKSEVILIPGTNEITTEAVLEQTTEAVPEITRDGSNSIILVPEFPENTLPAIPSRVISPLIPEQTTDEIILRPFKSIPEYTVPAAGESTTAEIPENTIPAVPSYITPKVPESTIPKVPEDTTNQPITDYKSQEVTTFAGTNTTYDNFTSFIKFQTDTTTKANWIINSTEAYQTTNNTGYAMLLSPRTFKPKYINISFNVPSTADNDWLGFVFGYKNSNTPFYTLSVARNDSRDNSNDYGLLLKTYNPTLKSTTSINVDPDKLYYGWKIGTGLTTLTLIYNKDKDIYDFLFNGVKKFSVPASNLDMEGMVGPFSMSQDNGRFKDLAINESDETTTFNTPEVKTVAEIPEVTTLEVPEKINPAVPPKYVSHAIPEVTTAAKPESTSPRIEPTFLKEYKPESTRTFTCPSIERVANLENSITDILDNKKHLHFIELKHPIGFDNKLIIEVHTIYDSMLYFDRDDKIMLSFYYYSHNYNTVNIKPINTTSLFITPMDEILVFEFKLPNDNEMSITPKIGVYASITSNREYDWQPFKEILTVYDKQEIYIPWKLQGNEYNIYYPSSTYSVSLVDSNIIEDSYNPFELLIEKDVVNILDKYNNNLVSDITNAFNIIFETEIPSSMLNYLFNLFMNNPGNLDNILKTVQMVGVSANYSIKNDYNTVDKSFFNLDKTKEDMVALASNSAFETDTNKRNKFIQQPKQYMIDVLLNENIQTDINLQERIDIPFTEYVLARFNIFGHVSVLKDNVDTLLGKTYYRTDLYTKYGKKYGDSNTYRFFNGNIQMLNESFKFVDIPFIQENYNIYKLIKPEYSRNKVLPVQKLLAKEINQIIEPSFSFLNVYNNNNRKLTFELTRFMNILPYAYKLVYKSPRVNLQQNNLMSNHISLTYENPFYDEFYELSGSTNTGNNITGNQKIYADLVYGQVPFGFIETILYHESFKNQIDIPDIYNYIKFLFEKIIQYKPSAEILKEIYNDIINELKVDIISNVNFDIFEQCKNYIINYLYKYNFILLDDINIITVNNFYSTLIQKLNTSKDYSIEMFNKDINIINYWTKDKARQEHNDYKDKVKSITLNTQDINIDACLEYLYTKKLNTISVNIPMDNVITTKDDKIVGYFVLYLYYYFPNNPSGFKYRRIPTLIQESGNIHKIAHDFTTNLTEFKVI